MSTKYLITLLLLMGLGCTVTTPQFSEPPSRQFIEMEAELVFDEAMTNYRENRLSLAIQNFEALVRSYPSSRKCPESLYLMSTAYHRLKNFDDSIRAAKTIIENYPQSRLVEKAYLLLAKSYFAKNDYVNAAFYALQSVEEEAELLLYDLANSYLSPAELDNLIMRNPNAKAAPHLLFRLAERYVQKNELGQARIALQNLILTYPGSSDVSAAKNLYNQIKVPGTSLADIHIFSTGGDSLSTRDTRFVAGDVLSIGVICPFSDRFSVYGQAVHAGIKLAVSQFEKRTRQRIRLITKDSAGEPIKALQSANQLIGEEKVTAIVGPIMSGPTIAVAGIAQNNQIPLITPTATDEGISSIGTYIFRLNATSTSQGYEMAEYAYNRLGHRTFGLLYSTNTGAIQLAQSFASRVRQLGAVVVCDQQYVEGTADFREQMLALRDSLPEAIYIPATPDEIILIAPQLVYHHVDAQMLGADGWNQEKVIRLGERHVEGAIFTAQFYGSVDSQSSMDFRKTFRYEYGYDPDRTATLGYDSVKLILSCIEAGYRTPRTIRTCLAQTRNFEGASGRITFTPGGDARRDVIFLTISEGHIMEVKD